MELGHQIDMWSRLKKLGEDEPVEWYKLIGHDRSGGYSTDVFEETPTEIETVIRPWEDDINATVREGQSGQTTGFKMYVPTDLGVARNDRIHWKGGAFRVANPQHDGLAEIVRFDLRADERDVIHEADLVDSSTMEAPDRGGFGGY